LWVYLHIMRGLLRCSFLLDGQCKSLVMRDEQQVQRPALFSYHVPISKKVIRFVLRLGLLAGQNLIFNKMKKLLLMVAVMMSAMSMSAQNDVGQFSVAPVVGLNFAKMTFDDAKFKTGVQIGAVAEYGLLEKLGLSAGLVYSMQGTKFDNESLKANYLNVPVLANYYVIPGLAVKAGLQPGFLLSAKMDGENVKDELKSFDLSIPVGVSYEYQNFVVDARYNLGVTKVSKVGDSAKNQVVQLTLAYKFKL